MHHLVTERLVAMLMWPVRFDICVLTTFCFGISNQSKCGFLVKNFSQETKLLVDSHILCCLSKETLVAMSEETLRYLTLASQGN